MANERTEKDEIFDYVKEAVLALEKEKETGKEATPAQKLSLNINGAKYEFDTQEQLDAAVTTLTNTARTQIEELQKKTSVEKPGSYVSGKENEPQFNDDEYIKLMHDDIPKAQKYALDHVFGIPNAVETIKNSLAESAALKSTVAVYQFRERHPEVNITDKTTTDALEGIRRELGLPFTIQALEASLGVAQSRGLIESPQLTAYKKQQEQANAPQGGDPASNGFTTGFTQRAQAAPPAGVNNSLGFQPPPGVSRSAPPVSGDFGRAIEDMPFEELEKILKRGGYL